MKKAHYILNTKTDQSFDTMEMKFYNSNWEPEFKDDKNYLQLSILLITRKPFVPPSYTSIISHAHGSWFWV